MIVFIFYVCFCPKRLKFSRKKNNNNNPVFRRNSLPVGLNLDLYHKKGRPEMFTRSRWSTKMPLAAWIPLLSALAAFLHLLWRPANIESVAVLMAEFLLDCSASEVTDTQGGHQCLLWCHFVGVWQTVNINLLHVDLLLLLEINCTGASRSSDSFPTTSLSALKE